MTKKSDPSSEDLAQKLDTVTAELVVIKRLIGVALLRNGLSQQDLADALSVNQSTVSRMIAGREPKQKGRSK